MYHTVIVHYLLHAYLYAHVHLKFVSFAGMYKLYGRYFAALLLVLSSYLVIVLLSTNQHLAISVRSAHELETVLSLTSIAIDGNYTPTEQHLTNTQLSFHSKEYPKPTVFNNSLSSFASRFPRIMIIGFGKAGTKTLYEFLKYHPQLSGPETEMRFFSRHYDQGLESYLSSLPPPSHNGFVIEKSPDYVIVPEAAGRIIASADSLGIPVSKLKFVVMLRNPIDRAMSEYLEWKVQRYLRRESVLPGFDTLVTLETGELNLNIKFINTSCYAYHLRRWLKHFRAKQMCYADGDAFISNPYQVIQKLESCLNLNPYFTEDNFVLNHKRGFYCFQDQSFNSHLHCMGESKGRPHPPIKKVVRDRLVEYFSEWDETLKNITGIN